MLHPRNPYVPALHANFRYFEVAGADWWFGGGCDLTPAYGFDDDAIGFHQTLKSWCDRHNPAWYPAWKAACDEYFTIAHRGEVPGIGGVFFDYLSDPTRDSIAAGMRSSTAFPRSCPPICRSSSAVGQCPTASGSGPGSYSGGAGTWSSTWCMTGERDSGWRPAATVRQS
jgi:coproporphyrinogen III oxidase